MPTPSKDISHETDEDFLRLPDVMKRSGLSKSEIYRRIQEGTFPKSHAYATRRVGKSVFWLASELRQWQKREVMGIN